VYGFRSEGLRVKTLPCCSKCTTLCAVTKVRHHWMHGFRKCGSRDKLAKAKPPTPLATERVSKDTGVGAPQGAENRSCGPFIPFGKAWEYQRAWHRCAASAAEIERNRSCEGGWKTFCAPHLSLPKGLNLERGRGVEHVRKRQRKGESSTRFRCQRKACMVKDGVLET
jgi:hypothetical protein